MWGASGEAHNHRVCRSAHISIGRRALRSETRGDMTIAASLLLIAVGAILKYALTASLAGIDLQTVGLILMIAGLVGLVLGLYVGARGGSQRVRSE